MAASYCARASAIVAVSEATKRDLVQFYGVDPAKVTVVYEAAATHFQPAPPARIAAVRDTYHLPTRFLIHLSTIEPRKNLLRLLELRLDNVVYRLGFGASRRQARQLIRHGHFQVNGRRVDIPSYRVRPEDQIAAAPTSAGAQTAIEEATDLTASVPAWLQADHDNLTGKVLRVPMRDDVDIPVQEQLIVELYSK